MPVPTSGDLTIDQLSARTGVSVRTIRFYAARGLLPPPQLRGRTGLYGPDHVARLELVVELSALGFTLAAVETQLQQLPATMDAVDLSLHRALLASWVPEQVETIDRKELERRAGRSLEADDLITLQELGVISDVNDRKITLHGSTTLALGLAILESGLPDQFLRRAHKLIEDHTDALATDLMMLFQRQVLQPYRDQGRPAEERDRLARIMSQLRPIAVRDVVTTFGRAINRTIRGVTTEGSPALPKTSTDGTHRNRKTTVPR